MQSSHSSSGSCTYTTIICWCHGCTQSQNGWCVVPSWPGCSVVHPSSNKNSLQYPCLWRAPFPEEIQQAIVSSSNPLVDISNRNLELCGTVAHDDILASTVPVSHLTTCNLSDNTPSVAWRTKGSTTTTGPVAYLLQVSSLHQRHFRYKPELHHIPGIANTMADDCSRLWHLNDSQLVAYFNVKYPQKNRGKCSTCSQRCTLC